MDNGYYEARQHLDLSQQAYDIIESDKLDFMARPSFAGMLNLVFSVYCQDADASVDEAVLRYTDELRMKTEDIPEDEKKRVISALAESKRKELAAAANSYPRGCRFKFQLNRENYEFIRSWHDEGNYYHSSAAGYIKAVVEEYASKSYFQREEILLRDRICLLQSYIEAGKMLTLTSGSGDSARRFTVKPYCLCSDKGSSFHYLVGLSTAIGGNDGEKPASFRISRLTKITPLSSRSGRITAAQKKWIDERLDKVGVQFMTQESSTVRVLLSPSGRQQYERRSLLRPVCIEKHVDESGAGEYLFQCAPMQALFYFFKFGADAVVLSPPELKAEMLGKYEQAYKKYREEES